VTALGIDDIAEGPDVAKALQDGAIGRFSLVFVLQRIQQDRLDISYKAFLVSVGLAHYRRIIGISSQLSPAASFGEIEPLRFASNSDRILRQIGPICGGHVISELSFVFITQRFGWTLGREAEVSIGHANLTPFNLDGFLMVGILCQWEWSSLWQRVMSSLLTGRINS